MAKEKKISCNPFDCFICFKVNIEIYFRLAAFFAAFFFVFFHDLQVRAQPEDQAGSSRGIPWHIVADEVRYDKNTDRYFAAGNVLITKENLKLSADRVYFHHNTMEVFADGHVMLVSGRDILTGERMEIDLNMEVGVVFDGTIFIEESHFYIRGDRLEKTGPDTYRAERASLTSCDQEKPAWKINARNVEVTIEGYGLARNASLWAKDIPVFYSPYLFFPVKRQRQTGFLTPQLGYSDRKGVEYIQPFFWAIDKNSDATFYEHFMSERGNKLGAEYRYIVSSDTKGAVMADVLNDQKVDDGTGSSSEDWGFPNDPFLRPNKDRYWFRMKHDQELPSGFFGRVDLDIVSDQDYLNEFKSGYNSFDETKRHFLREFGRDIDDYNDPVRVNRLNVFRNWNLYSLNAEAQWYDDVIKRRQEDINTTLHRLPFISFNSLRQPMVTPDLLYDFESEYTYFFREDGYTGHRIDIHPRFYLPLRYRNYFSFEPSIGVRETLWYLDDQEGFLNDNTSSFSRELVDARLDLSTDLSRSYAFNSKTVNRIKHTIRPQVVYNFIPPTSQDNLPLFDEVDRIEKVSAIAYSITNTFSLRSMISADKLKTISKGDDLENDLEFVDGFSGYAYRPFCRLKVEQIYDFNETIEDKPFSPIFARLDLTAGRFLSLNAEAQWSTYENHFLNYNVAVRAADQRGDRIFLQHRYARDRQETFYGDAIIKLHENISLFTEYERNIKDKRTLLYGIGLLYMASCWSLDIGYADEEGDKRYALMVNLYGLGGIGTAYTGRMIENPFTSR